MKKTIASLAAVLAFSLPAANVRAQKQEPPAPGTPKGFSLPARTSFALPNGMRVSLVPYGIVPKVAVGLMVRVGNIDEGQDTWLADLMGELMREGTRTRTATQISEAVARMGGSVEISVGEDRTRIGGEVLSEFGPEMVELVADLAQNPSFPEGELPRLKANLVRQLSIQRSQAQALAQEAFRSLLYGDRHPYGRYFPAAEALQAYTLAQVKALYDAKFGAARAHLYVVGRYDERAVEAAIRKAFSPWRKGPEFQPNLPSPTSSRRVKLIDRPGAVQSTLVIGLPVVDPSKPDWVPLAVTNALLGGSFASRITSNIREQKGYTYSPGSQVSSRYRDAFWAENADVTSAVTGASIKEILFEIDRLRKEPPSAVELKGIQNYLSGTFVLQNSSRQGIVAQLDFVDTHGLSEKYLADYVAQVNAVTPQVVQEMATRYLDPGRLTIVVVGDRKTVEDQVKEYGPVS